MEYRPLSIEGAWEITPKVFADPRGLFTEVFSAPAFEGAVDHPLAVRQVNCSVSAAGVVRGIHFADVPPSQAKYVTCVSGAVLDVVIDIRVGSPTFGQWDTVLLDDVDRRAIYLSEGLGHAFMSLEDGSVVTYLCSETYQPDREHGIHPLDPDLAIAWPTHSRGGEPLAVSLSPKDEQAPSFTEATTTGLLPTYDAARAFRSGL
ncbi:MAG: dTDP-4-dehydrorhamnose 3,5-epimerase [Micrococcales bacterium]|nr:dTDP-4-dehydrorhamnose 3,5-epimerase [Micrococcales bacterium]